MLKSKFILNPAFWRSTTVRFTSTLDPEAHAFEKVTLKKRGDEVNATDFRNKAVLVFFSAGWCNSCKEFTPYLKEFYENTKNQGVEVVWISRDRSADDQVEYYEKNLPPWPYVPFGTPDIRAFLQLYKIQTIPAIKLINLEGNVVDDGARVKIEKNYSNAEACKEIVEEWRKKLNLSS